MRPGASLLAGGLLLLAATHATAETIPVWADRFFQCPAFGPASVTVPPGAVEIVGVGGYAYTLDAPLAVAVTIVWWHEGTVRHRLDQWHADAGPGKQWHTVPPRREAPGAGHTVQAGDLVWADFYCPGTAQAGQMGSFGAYFLFRIGP